MNEKHVFNYYKNIDTFWDLILIFKKKIFLISSNKIDNSKVGIRMSSCCATTSILRESKLFKRFATAAFSEEAWRLWLTVYDAVKLVMFYFP